MSEIIARNIILLGVMGIVMNAVEAKEGSVNSCKLTTIPKKSKKSDLHGISIFVYPGEIPEKFTGCQTVWLEDGFMLIRYYYKKGMIEWVKSMEPKGGNATYCLYKDGILVKNKSTEDCDSLGYGRIPEQKTD